MRYYKLNGRTPVEAVSFDGCSHIADEKVGGYRVSTIFLGMDHSWGEGPPLLFETMVFGPGALDQEQDRCSTYEEAEAMHAKWVKNCQEDTLS